MTTHSYASVAFDPNVPSARPQAVARSSQPDAAPAGVSVDLRGLSKAYGGRTVLDAVDLQVRPGEFLAIVGRSGCGKSTLLKLLAGLEQADAGTVARSGDASDLRLMFQDARLLPWKRVVDNVALGLKSGDALKWAREVLGWVGLADRAAEWPANLSGGQRQRVALARALAHRPRLLLLDEPLGALDALTRIEMQRLIESLWRRQRFTAVMVTHDVPEAVAMADRIVLLEDGRVALDERVGLERPRLRGSATFGEVEQRILDRLLGEPPPPGPADGLDFGVPAQQLRFAD